MKARSLILAAAALVLPLFILGDWLAALDNRRETESSRLVLRPREVHRVEMPGESSVVLLRVNWDTDSGESKNRHRPVWLDPAKLESLGFDCHVPPEASFAERHYGSQLPRKVVLVLRQSPSNALASGSESEAAPLQVVDAGLDPAALRLRYPDSHTHALVWGTIRPGIHRNSPDDSTERHQPILSGWILGLRPAFVFVPAPLGRLLHDQQRSTKPDPKENADIRPSSSPPPQQWSVTVAWGPNLEPWVVDGRLKNDAGQR
ncbi:MAG: DUF4824 family protein [Verrucomicrobiales bacterium]|nr:DUF4824 family protein [Verrucomicrobiales bacterium]